MLDSGNGRSPLPLSRERGDFALVSGSAPKKFRTLLWFRTNVAGSHRNIALPSTRNLMHGTEFGFASISAMLARSSSFAVRPACRMPAASDFIGTILAGLDTGRKTPAAIRAQPSACR
ncbi:MAG: hypothetical protein ACR2IF_00610 [Terriglobales bacterium]